ncbi:hypothetical protein [Bartonella rattimassiliensis]|uniref:Uncharacterized protein n=1 Tax=Bartonella rattimassiliensis 15908 TaxID=1094556 RepID=J0QBC3_9HYPH|nr:hypothetical protein [Bartonella rattimassiliensis]EJF82626.1 hypothetical protein MCY_01683 [Bartonella rattimassiliensis 15908]
MSIDIDAIRQKIALEFNQFIPPNDPILMTVFLSDTVLNSALKTLREHQNQMVNYILTARNDMVEEEKKAAGKLITEAAIYIQKEINEEVQKNLNSISEQMKSYELSLSKISIIKSNVDEKMEIFLKKIRNYMVFIGASLLANILVFFTLIIHYYLH